MGTTFGADNSQNYDMEFTKIWMVVISVMSKGAEVYFSWFFTSFFLCTITLKINRKCHYVCKTTQESQEIWLKMSILMKKNWPTLSFHKLLRCFLNLFLLPSPYLDWSFHAFLTSREFSTEYPYHSQYQEPTFHILIDPLHRLFTHCDFFIETST